MLTPLKRQALELPEWLRTKLFHRCHELGGNDGYQKKGCCDHLTPALAETLCVCASTCNRPERTRAYESCIGNPSGDTDVSESCCEDLTDGDAKLLQVCADKTTRVDWKRVKEIIAIAREAYEEYQRSQSQ
jgi:hypothetical protein